MSTKIGDKQGNLPDAPSEINKEYANTQAPIAKGGQQRRYASFVCRNMEGETERCPRRAIDRVIRLVPEY